MSINVSLRAKTHRQKNNHHFLLFYFQYLINYFDGAFTLCLVQPSLRSIAIKGARPSITSSFVAPSATVAGNVQIGSNSAVWYGAIVRGQTHSVTIGENSSVGDLSVISSLSANTRIGSNVSIGSGVSVTDSVVGDNSVLGDGVKLLRNVKVESRAVVAAGSVVPAGQVWGGSPASYQRDLTAAELHALQATHADTLQLAVLHAGETAKTWETIEREEFDFEDVADRNSEYYQRLTHEDMSKAVGEVEGHMVPGRIFDSPGQFGLNYSCFLLCCLCVHPFHV